MGARMRGDNDRTRARGGLDRTGAERVAVAVLGFLAAEPERLAAFLETSGLDPRTLRQAAADPGFFPGLLDYIAGDETLLIAFAQDLGETPERVMEARRLLSPTEEA